MPKLIVSLDTKKCTGVGYCQSVQPILWSVVDRKAKLLKGSLKSEDTYEVDADEPTMKAIKESALVCPNYAIEVLDDKGSSILGIKGGKSVKFRIIKSHYDSRKEWVMDPMGFFTIKPFPKENIIRVRFYNSEYQLAALIEGENAEDIFNTIVREKLLTSLAHAAYLGSELQKAEIALKLDIEYIQDDPLDLNKK